MDTCAVCGLERSVTAKRPCPQTLVNDLDARIVCQSIGYEREKAASASLREQLARVTRERDEYRRLAEENSQVGLREMATANEYMNALAAARSRIEALEGALRAAEPKIRMALHAAQDPLADMVRRCHNDRPHNHNHMADLRRAMRELTEAHAEMLAALASAEPAAAPEEKKK